MKKLFSIVVLFTALMISQNSFAQVKFVENFSYPVGDSIGAHGWTYNSGTLNPLLVTTGLTYAGYPGSGVGNGLSMLATGNDAYKNWDANDSAGTVYCSFMLNVATASTAGDYFFAMLPGTSTSLYTCRLTVKDSLGAAKFGLSKGTVGSGIGYTSGTYAYGTTILCVIKYKFNSGSTTDDEASMYIFTSGFPATEPVTATIPVVTSSATDVGNLGRCAVRQGGATTGCTCMIDGFKVGKTWGDLATSIHTTSTIADNFSLSQNYPNPFNPNTKISFSLPVNGVVSLRVYNTIGKEVSNLVNSRLNSGSYTVDFNGSNLNSGVYFYSLELSGENGKVYSEQKKLMLIK
ncbi:hypothetical protein BH10BAC5_BH10BAC5_01110 [soil metagenome]